MYVIKYSGAVPVPDYGHLYEMTAEEHAHAVKAGGAASYKVIPADEARKWVKEGRLHSTPLFVNQDGKVIYARENA